MKRYRIINNSVGWLCFVIAAVTYLLTVEPTASFWDCPEFILQGFKLEIGHPPGNPIFMLAGRFFVTIFGGSAQNAALAVNSMSALLSAGTILLLFWTVTHLVKKLIVADDAQPSALQTLVIMVSGVGGALAYAWSDTFWFSAVEGEVYAFSSFCTALVFWLILKWENRADLPHSDRYLVLIAYVIGVSIAVHLLNLLCIPAIVLVFYYKKFAHPNVKGSLMALGLSAVIVFLILYGLVPGFIAVAQRFELFFVNVLGCSFNVGVLVYALLTLAVFIWTIAMLYQQRSAGAIRWGVFLSIVLSGMPFVGHGWLVPVLLIAALVVWLWGFCRKIPIRIFNVLILSIFMIFIGYSSYALILIRSHADTPMNQNSPDNVFALASYLSREQYGDRPLLMGATVAEELDVKALGSDGQGGNIYGVQVDEQGYPATVPVKGIVYDNSMPVDNGTDTYAPEVKTSPDQPDRYVLRVHKPEYQYSSDMTMLLPRMYSSDARHVKSYKSWAEYVNPDFEAIPAEVRAKWAQKGYVLEHELRPYLDRQIDISQGTINRGGVAEDYGTQGWKMGIIPNLKYFVNYQLNHMYWRYFMWNFAGRQNDMQGNGEPHLGNWISGIPVIDNMRLGDQSQLPDEFGAGNKGHNKFYLMPLILGLIGLLWQALWSRHVNARRGIEQFWVVFFLFFMTGIAIVLYLNQTPGQPRERDYAFAGSFYAFAIWIGLGVAAISSLLARIARNSNAWQWASAGIATVVAVGVPVQMVSQTWDDHDRANRYTTRDFGMNYLNSLAPNAIIFTNGDNDTFPLWYAQEVEGCRTDVKVVNLSYLSTDWYANQMRQQSYEALPVPMYARPQDYAYDSFWMQRISDPTDSLASEPMEVGKALSEFYAGTSDASQRIRSMYAMSPEESRFILATSNLYAPLDSASTFAAFGRYPTSNRMDLRAGSLPRSAGLSTMLSFDIVANSAAGGWKRPVYFASTVPDNYYLGFSPYMYTTGMAKQVTPFADQDVSPVVDTAYRNIMERFRWGGLDKGNDLYLDETVRRMVSSTRLAVLDVVDALLKDPYAPASAWAKDYAKAHKQPVPKNRADMARALMALIDAKMPAKVAPYESMLDLQMAETYGRLWAITGSSEDLAKARQWDKASISRYSQLMRYANSLSPSWRGRLGASERAALKYLIVAVAFDNYLDLRQQMVKKGAPAEELDLLDRTFSLEQSYEAYSWVYLHGIDDDELDELEMTDGYYRMPVAVSRVLRQLHAQYGVPVDARTKSVAKTMGVPVASWQQLAH